MDAFCDNKTSKSAKEFVCNPCDFSCCKKGDWNRHITRAKHIKLTFSNTNDDKKHIYTCDTCNKPYNSRNGLWNHKKKCKALSSAEPTIEENKVIENTNNEIQEMKEFMKYLMKENTEMKSMMMELIKNNASGINNSHNTHTNSHNKTFNLQFFLNEQCKDAMNMSEFINQIQLKLSDLENVGKLGYVEGISNIIIKKLNDTDMYKRPLHCSDAKRETLYIKEEDKWEKESPENTNMKKMVKKVDYKNIGLIGEWKDSHPDHKESTCPDNDTYLKILVQSMSGDEEHVEKVIKKISKEVTIDK